MTEFTDKVEQQRQKNEAERWGKEIKQLYAHDGILETWYNNGDVKYEENKPKGKTTWHRETKESLMDKFYRWKADQR